MTQDTTYMIVATQIETVRKHKQTIAIERILTWMHTYADKHTYIYLIYQITFCKCTLTALKTSHCLCTSCGAKRSAILGWAVRNAIIVHPQSDFATYHVREHVFSITNNPEKMFMDGAET